MTQPTTFNQLVDAINVAPIGAAIEVEVPAMNVLAIEGAGHPGSDAFRQGVRDLWRVAYAIQQLAPGDWGPAGFSRFEMPPTEVVFDAPTRDGAWRLFFPQPAFVDQIVLDHVAAELAASGKPVQGQTFLATHSTERAVQSMHIGRPDAQPATIALIRTYAADRNLMVTGKHHEILIDDPVRIGFDQARNLIRYAVSD